MTNPSRVVLVRCRSYEQEQVDAAVNEGMALVGPVERIGPGITRLLLKPNLLHGDEPARGSTTHPAILKAVAKYFIARGFHVSYGDSPAFHHTRTAVLKSGYDQVARETGMDLADFEQGQEISFPEGKQNKLFFIALGALEAEAIINLPKLKTHGLTRMTGAVKNMFGIIPGVRKAWFHARLSDQNSFSRMLIDLNRLITPALSIMDGIYGMEGNGPRNGRLVNTGIVLLSTDPVALDATACRLMGIGPEQVYFLKYASENGFGSIEEKNIEIIGVPLDKAKGKPYALHPPDVTIFSTSPIQKHIKRFLIPRPVIESKKCTRCLQCVNICPVQPKALRQMDHSPPRYDYNHCIRCYCCQEICPEGAIRIRVPLLGALFHGFKRRF